MSYDLLKANTEIKSGLLSLKYREGHYSLKEIPVGSFEVNHRMASGGRYLKDHLVPISLLWKWTEYLQLLWAICGSASQTSQ